MSLYHQDQPTHCSDRETEETEAESLPKPSGWQRKAWNADLFSHTLALEC